MMRFARFAFISTVCLALFAVFNACAQQYPSKPIRVLIPSPPGGATDILGRLLREGFSAQWGQPVIIDNRGGASGRIAAAYVAKAAPDGYTLLFTYGGVLTTGLPLFKNLPYHPIKDFEPVAMLAHVPTLIVAHPSFPGKTVADIIRMAKANPGGLTHGASSPGSAGHLNMELFKQMAGIDMLAVAYNGDAPALIALLGAQVQFASANLVAAMAHIQAGKLRPIAVATNERVPALPDVPTVAESGIPGYESLLFYALVAPAKTPRSIVRQIHEAVAKMKQSPDVKQSFERLGAIPFDMTPEQLGEFLQRDLEKWTKVIRTANIQPE